MRKPLIAVITAIANSFAEHELLCSIIAENEKQGYATVVFSNIYNVVPEDVNLRCEQRIYELLRSREISGVILFTESFVTPESRSMVSSFLREKDIPVVGIGAQVAEFAALSIPCFNTDDTREVEALTDHLIDVHGMTDILMLSGTKDVAVSQQRNAGYLRSLQKHGITPDPDRLVYGDFWWPSGRALADSLISGERSMPQAILCANDRMAYGLLSRFSEAGIRVPQQVSVVSYEYSDHRLYYSPPLTCRRRDRETLGKAAAHHLHCLLTGAAPPPFTPPDGIMIFGASCPCRMNEMQTLQEQRDAAVRRDYYDLNLISTMEYRMTMCRDLEEFMQIIGDYQWMIRDKSSLYLRLYANWYDPDGCSDGLVQSRCIQPWKDTGVFETDRYDLNVLFEREPETVVCYYTPVFSGNRLFGDLAVLYDTPNGFDDVFRHWLKSLSIGLDFLRLKNDIRYLLSCQNVSEYRDTLTGLYNDKGLKRAYVAQAGQADGVNCCVMLRICLFSQTNSEDMIARKTDAVLGAARAVSRFCGSTGLAGHIRNDTFVCFVRSQASSAQLADLLAAIVTQESSYLDFAGMDSLACAAMPCEGVVYEALLAACTEQVNAIRKVYEERRKKRYFRELIELRSLIYAAPEITFEPDKELLPEGKTELYRESYKKCFGISFHQDCIAARCARAKCLLAATQMELSEISEKCGYVDHKYFQRQFAAVTGIPAMQYRSLCKA